VRCWQICCSQYFIIEEANYGGKNGKSLEEPEATFIFSDSKTAVGYFFREEKIT
jgi:hypothetical protein